MSIIENPQKFLSNLREEFKAVVGEEAFIEHYFNDANPKLQKQPYDRKAGQWLVALFMVTALGKTQYQNDIWKRFEQDAVHPDPEDESEIYTAKASREIKQIVLEAGKRARPRSGDTPEGDMPMPAAA